MHKQVVVAKYREDMAWLRDLPCPAIVYDKYPKVGRVATSNSTYITMRRNPPLGRESHSYIRHILDNYERLADVTFFVQGDPFVHSPSLRRMIQQDYHETVALGLDRYVGLVNDNYFLNYPGPPFPWKMMVRLPDDKLAAKWDFLFPGKPCPSGLVYTWGQQYAVPRHRILQRKKSFYFRMQQELCRTDVTKHPRTDAYSLEYLMFYVFGDEELGGYPDCLMKLACRYMA